MKRLYLHAAAFMLSVAALLSTPDTARANASCPLTIVGYGSCPFDAEWLCWQLASPTCTYVVCQADGIPGQFRCCERFGGSGGGGCPAT